jgi:prepilin-type N-terminal cleavage/methylation domain-containing protein
MICNGPKSAVSNQGGFTFVELLVVIAILGILAAIGMQQVANHRAKAHDAIVIALTKNVLTAVAIDEPTGGTAGPAFGGTLTPVGLPQVEVPDGVGWYVLNVNAPGNNQHDMWMFYFAHEKGKRGYYFWIPGDGCGATDDSVAGDGSGNNSDYIFYDEATGAGSYRNAAGV